MSVAPEGGGRGVDAGKDGDASIKKGHTRFRRRFSAWRRKGVVEVSPEHKRYDMLNCVRQAIQDLILNHPQLGPKSSLTKDDFGQVTEKQITANNKTFKFTSYASSVFANIRLATGITEDVYLKSLAPENKPYLEFLSNSHSGQDFFISHDRCFFLKTDKEYYVQVFLSLLRSYLDHFLKYPHSLMVRYLGVYSIEIPGEKKLFFYVMQNIFYPESRIRWRYDIKGCLKGRYQKILPPECEMVYKDGNFVQNEEVIEIGQQRAWLLQQLRYDLEFLRQQGFQDYSLLLGSHELNQDEKSLALGQVVSRVRRSLQPVTTEAFTLWRNIKISNVENNENKQQDILLPKSSSTITADLENASHDGQPEATSSGSNSNYERTPSGEMLNQKVRRSQEELEGEQIINVPNHSRSPGGQNWNQNESNTPSSTHDTVQNPTGPNDTEKTDGGLLNQSPPGGAVVKNRTNRGSLVGPVEAQGQNRRLLPNLRNGIHIIDGPHHRYFLGIIDFFTTFGARQRCVKILKDIKFQCGDHSTTPPNAYARRMIRFIQDHSA